MTRDPQNPPHDIHEEIAVVQNRLGCLERGESIDDLGYDITETRDALRARLVALNIELRQDLDVERE